MNDTETLADRTIFAFDPAGNEISLRLLIGKPYRVDGPVPWKGALRIEGIAAYEQLPDISGDDAWQVLMSVIWLHKMMLNALRIDGYKLFDRKDGTELKVEWIFGAGPPEEAVPDREMTADELELVATLSAAEIQRIDEALIRNSSTQFRKVLRVVGDTIADVSQAIPNTPALFYAQRIKHLVSEGYLEAEGDLSMMRFSEIRLRSLEGGYRNP